MTQQEEYSEQEVLSIADYLSMLAKHKLLVALCFLLGLSAAIFIALTAAPVYEATAKLTVKPMASKPASLTDNAAAVDSLFFQQLTVNTHLDLILSVPLLEKLINTLHLDQQKNTEPQTGLGLQQFIGQIKDSLRLLLSGEEKVLTPAEKKYLLAQALRGSITVENKKMTDLLNITAQNADPELAAKIANTLAKLYVQQDIANNQRTSNNSFSFLENQAEEFKIKLDQAEADFLTYKQKENIFSFEETQASIVEKKKTYDTMLIETRDKYQQIDLRLKELESLAGSKRNDAARLRSLLGNPVIDNLNNQLIAAEIEQSKLSKIYRSKHAEMQAVQTTISDLRRELNQQIKKEIASMRKERDILQASLEKNKSSIAELEREGLEISKKEKQYRILEDNVKTYKRYYETLMSKVEDMSVSSEVRNAVTDVNVVEHAQQPIYPVKPKKMLILLAGIFGGLFSGIGLALLLEFSDRTIHTEEDAQACCALPVLGSIPIAKQSICRNTLTAADGKEA